MYLQTQACGVGDLFEGLCSTLQAQPLIVGKDVAMRSNKYRRFQQKESSSQDSDKFRFEIYEVRRRLTKASGSDGVDFKVVTFYLRDHTGLLTVRLRFLQSWSQTGREGGKFPGRMGSGKESMAPLGVLNPPLPRFGFALKLASQTPTPAANGHHGNIIALGNGDSSTLCNTTISLNPDPHFNLLHLHAILLRHLAHVQRDQHARHAVIRRDRGRDLDDLSLPEQRAQRLEHRLRHHAAAGHRVRVCPHGRMPLVQAVGRGRGDRVAVPEARDRRVAEDAAGLQDGQVLVPLVHGEVERGDAADGELADRGGQRGLRADRAQEAVPAVGDGRRMEQRLVERDQLASSSGFDALHDGIVGRCGHGGVVGDVGEAHDESLRAGKWTLAFVSRGTKGIIHTSLLPRGWTLGSLGDVRSPISWARSDALGVKDIREPLQYCHSIDPTMMTPRLQYWACAISAPGYEKLHLSRRAMSRV
nr:hypothetical protein CFP56_01147 [Quercus suber]